MKIKNLIILMLLSITISYNGMAQKTLSKIIKNGELRVGTSATQPPFSMKTKTGETIGFDIELAKHLAESMGVKLTLVEMPFSDLLAALEDGKIDAILSGMTITPERNLRVFFAGPYHLSGKSMFTKSSVLAKINDPKMANKDHYKIVCLKGSTSEEYVIKNMPDSEMIAIEDYDIGVQMILDDKADAMVADYPICAISVMKYQSQGLVTLDKPFTIEPIGIALPKNDALFLNLVENYLSSLNVSGSILMLDKMWFEDGSWLLEVE